MPIPRILHFTWKTNDLPPFFADILEQWRQTHPDWDIRYYNDVDIRAFVAADYPAHLELFDRYPSGIFRADAFRYFVLHRSGGIYADLDVIPLHRLDDLANQADCFVGVTPEPDSDVAEKLYAGMPFVLCNAFMGSSPQHPFWSWCLDRLPAAESDDVVDATGPRFLNAAGLTAPPDIRPSALLPDAWSPLSGTGAQAPMTDAFARRVAQRFNVIAHKGTPLVSHLWRNSWSMPMHYKGPQFWRWPNRLQWALRRQRHTILAGTSIAAPRVEYDDQAPRQIPAGLRVAVALHATAATDIESVSIAVQRMTYPSTLMQIAVVGPKSSALAEALAPTFVDAIDLGDDEDWRATSLEWAAQANDRCLLVGNAVVSFPADAIERLLAAGREVAGAYIEDKEGQSESFLYFGDTFKFIYRNGAASGRVRPDAVGREKQPFGRFRALNYAPLTSVSLDFAMVDTKLASVGVLPGIASKFHTGSAAFCIAARDAGFEVCGVPSVVVTTTRR